MQPRGEPPMGHETDHLSQGAEVLREGSELGGLVLSRLIARDAFSSLWLTEPLESGFVESCVRAIPAAHLQSPDAYERLCSDLAFWRGLTEGVVELYECSRSGGYYFMVMRYVPEGSVADQLGRGGWPQEHFRQFAFDFAAVLCDLHSSSGPHGNLKASNVFPVRRKGVLLSDFAVPLWLDEFEKGCSALAPRLLHPYRAPEQVEDLRDFDTRSDVYSFGLVLWRCLTGMEPATAGEPPQVVAAEWPAGLGSVVERCLSPDREKRPADGLELLDMVGKVSGLSRRSVPGEPEESAAGRGAPLPQEAGPRQRAPSLEEARAMMDEGLLEEALGILESLPAETDGLSELLDEIEERQRAGDELAKEAVRLAGMGQMEAAAEAIREAERLWPKSEAVLTMKAELTGRTRGDEEVAPSGPTAEALRAALEDQSYSAARTLVEKLIRGASFTERTDHAIRQFKKGRVRKAFHDNLKAAKRLYVLGHWKEAKEQWLEAARWLPPGPHRERLRRIAGAAGAGKLRVAVQRMQPQAGAEAPPRRKPVILGDEGGPQGTGQAKKGRLAEWRPLLMILAAAAALLGGGLALLWALRGR